MPPAAAKTELTYLSDLQSGRSLWIHSSSRIRRRVFAACWRTLRDANPLSTQSRTRDLIPVSLDFTQAAVEPGANPVQARPARRLGQSVAAQEKEAQTKPKQLSGHVETRRKRQRGAQAKHNLPRIWRTTPDAT
eukprot:scaffold1397_cov254-Pinguiococcus_pyrenoidosus.AAC.55